MLVTDFGIHYSGTRAPSAAVTLFLLQWHTLSSHAMSWPTWTLSCVRIRDFKAKITFSPGDVADFRQSDDAHAETTANLPIASPHCTTSACSSSRERPPALYSTIEVNRELSVYGTWESPWHYWCFWRQFSQRIFALEHPLWAVFLHRIHAIGSTRFKYIRTDVIKGSNHLRHSPVTAAASSLEPRIS